MSTELPSAGLIRQELRTVLQEQILPVLRERSAPHLFSAQLPLTVPAEIQVREVPVPVLEESAAVSPVPGGMRWDDVGVHSIRFPVLCCVVAGEIDLRIGVTAEMLKHLARPRRRCGAYVVALPSPAFFVIPPGMPYTSGTFLPWERAEPQSTPAHIFWVRVLPTGALCHTTWVYDGQQQAQYSLLVEDKLLAPMIEILLAALQPARCDLEMARSQLLVLFLRLQQKLQQTLPLMTDGLHSRFPTREPANPRALAGSAAAQGGQSALLEKACDFIQFHLHEPLTPADVARHLRLKPGQLNRIFRKHLDTSVMRYVTRQRMETAKLLLQTSELSMQEISRLVGYKYLSHFSRSFNEHVGMPPLKYRQNQVPPPLSARRKP